LKKSREIESAEIEHTKPSRTEMLGKEKIPRLLMKFSIPAIAGMIVQAVYNIVDRIFVGRYVGSDGLSALTTVFPIMLVFMAFALLLGIGGSSFFSITLGEKKEQKAAKILGNTFSLVLILISSFAAVSLIFINPILKILGASVNILPMANEYAVIILAGAVINGTAFTMNAFIRSEGSAHTAMYTMLIGGITNIILDYYFIAVLGMGIKGAALATVIAQSISACWVISYFTGKRAHIRLKIKNFSIERDIVKRIFILGSPIFTMHIASSLINGMLNNQLQRYGGDTALSVMGIVFSIMTLIIMPVFGINQGSMPITGYNYGAKKYKRVIHTVLLAAAAATVIMTTGFIVTRIFPEELIKLFGKKNTELLEPGIAAIKIFFMMLPLIGFQVVASGYFQATGKPGKAMLMTLSRQVIFLIPFVIIFPLIWGLNGVWISVASADFAAAILTAFLFLHDIRILKKESIKQEADIHRTE
jgi:MATE family, multidrug efflux pump